jgi:hypothetical protein
VDGRRASPPCSEPRRSDARENNFFVSLDGDVASPDGRPVQLLCDDGLDAGELWLHVVPMLLGGGEPLTRGGSEPVALALRSTRTFPDGVVELGYRMGERA